MINTEQQNEILKYLKNKGLSEDMQIEILDHIMNQIEWEMQETGAGFENAFEKIKNIWRKDFENVWLVWYKVPLIQKEKLKSVSKIIFVKSLVGAVIFTFFVFWSMVILRQDKFLKVYEYYSYTMLGIPFLFLLLNFKIMFSIPFRRGIIATEDLFILVPGLCSGIISLQMRNIRKIDVIFERINNENFIFFFVVFLQTLWAIYMVLAVCKFCNDVKRFKKIKQG